MSPADESGFFRPGSVRACVAAVMTAVLAGAAPAAEKTSRDDPQLKILLRLFPSADANGDGILTESEAKTYYQKVQAEKAQPGGAKKTQFKNLERKTVMVAMRDGVKLATEVLVPPGVGPWPAVVVRTPYGRDQAATALFAAALVMPCGVVTQDMRGLHDSEGRFNFFRDDIDDGYDTVEWVARQPWCNGKVAITGGSGPGIAAKLAMISKPPHLAAAATTVAASSPYLYAAYHGGVLRQNMHDRWLRERGVRVEEWPKPRTMAFDKAEQARTLAANAQDNRVALYDVGGWYDIFLQSALDDFVAMRPRGKVRVVVGGFGHGPLEGLKYPADARPPDRTFEWLTFWLIDAGQNVAAWPAIVYYLMGDTMNLGAPGNAWKQAQTWPIPNTPRSYYLTGEGRLEVQPPRSEDASLGYSYDPKDPVPTIGGANLYLPKGPMDQRPLKDRKDILRFTSRPLLEPMEVTGKVLLELHVSTDVPDTTFMAKVIDVYPNGYEALVVDSAMMARYWQGLDKPAPLEKGKVYKLTIDLWSTALVFDRGHRVAVHVAGSNSPRYEVHPNSYAPVMSYDSAPVANNAVHVSARHPSRLILPVIAPGVGKDFDIKKLTR